VLGPDQRSFSDTQSEVTLINEKDIEKDNVDWVKVISRLNSADIKLGFQGKSPETDFRATGRTLPTYSNN
jgi:hypothetical protein